MTTTAYADWISLYNPEFDSIWSNEPKKLKKLSMIYHAIQKEFSKIKNELASEITNIRSELSTKNLTKSPENKENSSDNSLETDGSKSPIRRPGNDNLLSPPISPAIKSKRIRRRSKKPPETNSKCFRNLIIENKKIDTVPIVIDCNSPDILDSSVIECTPKLLSKSNKKLNKCGFSFPSNLKTITTNTSFTNQKNERQITLTQIIEEPESKLRKIERMSDDDATCIDDDCNSLEIDDMLDLINEDNSDESTDKNNFIGEKISNNKEVENAENKYLISSSFIENYDKLPENKTKEPNFVYQPDPVRGKERKKLPGWSCKECEQFYNGLNLPPDELQKKLNECSKHRNKFQPREETYDGFWDLTFKPTPPTQQTNTQKSMVFNFRK